MALHGIGSARDSHEGLNLAELSLPYDKSGLITIQVIAQICPHLPKKLAGWVSLPVDHAIQRLPMRRSYENAPVRARCRLNAASTAALGCCKPYCCSAGACHCGWNGLDSKGQLNQYATRHRLPSCQLPLQMALLLGAHHLQLKPLPLLASSRMKGLPNSMQQSQRQPWPWKMPG